MASAELIQATVICGAAARPIWLCCLLLVWAGTSGCGSSPTTLAVEGPIADPVSSVGSSSEKPVEGPAPGKVNETDSPTASTPSTSSNGSAAETGSTTPDKSAPMTIEPKLTDVDADRLVGRWQDSFFGKRTLILNADGTARMILDLDLAGQLLYGKRLEFDMKWSVESARVTIDILEGKPEKSAKSAMKMWGNRYVYLLDRVEDHHIEMRSSDGSMSHTLRRVADENPS